MMNWKKGFFWGILLTFVLPACHQDKNIPDVSDIKVNIDIQRFEQDLFALDSNALAAGIQQLEAKYPAFSRIFFDEILDADNEQLAPNGRNARILDFVKDPFMRHLYDTVQIVFPELNALEQELEQAFRFYKYYFPSSAVPHVTSFISGFDYAAFVYGDDTLAVGLDGFLGEKFPYAQYNPGNPNFSEYLVRTFTKEHLVSKMLQPLLEDHIGLPGGTQMLDLMIHNGKKLYLLDKVLPYTPDSIKLEISAQQVKWLEDNEMEMWAYFLKENLLYSTDWQSIRKYVEYSPHSPGMPPEAPGRTANWLGWQIVKAYMERNPNLSLQTLMAEKNAQTLLEKSKYKPKR